MGETVPQLWTPPPAPSYTQCLPELLEPAHSFVSFALGPGPLLAVAGIFLRCSAFGLPRVLWLCRYPGDREADILWSLFGGIQNQVLRTCAKKVCPLGWPQAMGLDQDTA